MFPILCYEKYTPIPDYLDTFKVASISAKSQKLFVNQHLQCDITEWHYNKKKNNNNNNVSNY